MGEGYNFQLTRISDNDEKMTLAPSVKEACFLFSKEICIELEFCDSLSAEYRLERSKRGFWFTEETRWLRSRNK